jgi:hypothetical protein
MNPPTTFCNPLPLPDYPRGVFPTPGQKRSSMFWLENERRDFGSAANPTVA